MYTLCIGSLFLLSRVPIFSDETLFHTKPTTGGRSVRRPRGANRFDPNYTVQRLKHPKHILFWRGISASGKRFYSFLKPKEKMNSVRYISALKRALKLLKQEKLTMCTLSSLVAQYTKLSRI